jgi:predicted AAA+ superfamily ATPase
VGEIERRLRRQPALLQAVVGPRQVGKTTSLYWRFYEARLAEFNSLLRDLDERFARLK